MVIFAVRFVGRRCPSPFALWSRSSRAPIPTWQARGVEFRPHPPPRSPRTTRMRRAREPRNLSAPCSAFGIIRTKEAGPVVMSDKDKLVRAAREAQLEGEVAEA